METKCGLYAGPVVTLAMQEEDNRSSFSHLIFSLCSSRSWALVALGIQLASHFPLSKSRAFSLLKHFLPLTLSFLPQLFAFSFFVSLCLSLSSPPSVAGPVRGGPGLPE